MPAHEWWDKVSPASRDWLRTHRDEAMPAGVADDVFRARGPVTSGAWWPGVSSGPDGFYISDDAQEWIEILSMDDETLS